VILSLWVNVLRRSLSPRAITYAKAWDIRYAKAYDIANPYGYGIVNAYDIANANAYAIAYAIAIANAYAIAIAKVNGIAIAIANAIAYLNPKANAYAITIANAYAIAIAKVNGIAIAIANAIAYLNPKANAYAITIANAIAGAEEFKKIKIFKDVNWTKLIAQLTALKDRFADANQSDQIDLAFFDHVLDTWCNALHLNIGIVKLSNEEAEALKDYFYANYLIIQCQAAAVRISAKTWEKIESRMLVVPENSTILEIAEEQKLWELLEAELFPDDEDSPEDIAEIEVARADYKAGEYTTFHQYTTQRARKST
jgi:hypothetical protein